LLGFWWVCIRVCVVISTWSQPTGHWLGEILSLHPF